MRWIALVLLVLTAGCGGNDDPLRVQSRSALAWTHAPEVEAQARALAHAAAEWWGSYPGALEGWTIVIVDDWIPWCGVYPPTGVAGCSAPDLKVIGVSTRLADGNPNIPGDPGRLRECVAQFPIAHEVGHAAAGILDHAGPRWSEVAWAFPMRCD